MSAWDDLSDAARELICERSELDIAEDYVTLSARHDEVFAELAALHEGEEPYEDDCLAATPAQWIWLWNRATPARRLDVAGQTRDLSDQADRCLMGFHERRVAELRAAEARIAAVRAALDRALGCVSHEAAALRAEIRAALDGPAEQTAAVALPRQEHMVNLVALAGDADRAATIRRDAERWDAMFVPTVMPEPVQLPPLTALDGGADARQDAPPTVSVLADGEWKPVPGIASVQFNGLDGVRNDTGPTVPYHPPIPGIASRRVDLNRARLRAQVTALLLLSTPTT